MAGVYLDQMTRAIAILIVGRKISRFKYGNSLRLIKIELENSESAIEILSNFCYLQFNLSFPRLFEGPRGWMLRIPRLAKEVNIYA